MSNKCRVLFFRFLRSPQYFETKMQALSTILRQSKPKAGRRGVHAHLISPMLLPMTFVVGLFLAFSNI